MKTAIRDRARELGFDDCRFTTAQPPDHGAKFERWIAEGCHGEMKYLARNAQKRLDPQQVLPGARSIITLAVSYGTAEAEAADASSPARNSGVLARYAQFGDYHDLLGEKLRLLSACVEETAPGGAQSLWYVDTGPLLERDFAQRAGLGFIGKHTNLISRQFGNWIFLSEILTTAEIEPDPPEHNHCGSCTRCLAACPTGAITAPFQLDARRCISYLTIEFRGSIPVELRPLIGNRIFGCDDCLAVCPWNRFGREGKLMAQHRQTDLAKADLLELLSIDEKQFQQRFAGTPLLRCKWQGLLRNVCVALGNVGDAAVLPALRVAADHSSPLVAEHAVWAVGQIGKRSAKIRLRPGS